MNVGILIIVAAMLGALLNGSFGFVWLSLVLLGYAVVVTRYIHKRYCQIWTKPFSQKVGIFTLWLFSIGVGSFLIVQGLIASACVWNQNPTSEYLLVPGAGIIRREPSFTLARRLDTAINYLNVNPEAKVIVSGGLSDGQLASEAQVMAWYLEKHDISAERILLEENASNTLENILLSKEKIELIHHKPLEEIIIITSDYHMLRAQMLANRMGIKAVGVKSSSPLGLYRQYAMREYFAIFKSMLLDWP